MASVPPIEGHLYPFERPLEAFVFDDGDIVIGEGDHKGRHPVLAAGSNAAPAQLLRKLGRGATPVPVTPALLRDHAIVYSAHFASYGALPATLYALPGAIAWLSVTWLDDAQLEQMHVSENLGVNNDFFVDAEIEVTTEAGERLTPIGLYTSRKGPLTHEGRPIRLAELPTAGTSLPALTQPAVLRYVHKRLGDDTPYSDFMHRVIADPEFRADVNARIAAFG